MRFDSVKEGNVQDRGIVSNLIPFLLIKEKEGDVTSLLKEKK